MTSSKAYWSQDQVHLHINVLELPAVWEMLKQLQHEFQGQYHSGQLHPETGGHQVTPDVGVLTTFIPMGRETPYHS